MLEGIPVLSAVFSFTTDNTPVLELGDVREYQKEGLVLLMVILLMTIDYMISGGCLPCHIFLYVTVDQWWLPPVSH